MRSKIGNWGGSSAVRLPRQAVRQLGITEGNEVDVEVADGALVIKPVKPRYSLQELLADAKTCAKPPLADDVPTGAEWPDD